MRALLLAIAGLVGGGITGIVVGYAIIFVLDLLGWLNHGADGLGVATAFLLLSGALAVIFGLAGAVWGIVAGSRGSRDRV